MNKKPFTDFPRDIQTTQPRQGFSFGAAQARDYPPKSHTYSIGNAIRAIISGESLTGLEGEMHREIERQRGGTSRTDAFYLPTSAPMLKRDMTSAGTNGSQYLVATDNLAGSFIEMLRNRAVIAQLGATFLPGLVGNVTIPKQSASATAYWLSNEATAITESQMTIGQLSLTPKTVGAYAECSRQLLKQSSPAVDKMIMDDLAKVIALAVDAAAINGSGAGGQPTGLMNTAGIGSVVGTSLGFAGVMEFQTDCAENNALTEKGAYLTTPTVATLLQQRVRFASTNSPLWDGNTSDGMILGQRAMSTLQMPAGSMLFGDWSNLIVGEWGSLEIAITDSNASNFMTGIYGIRAMQSIDIGVRQAGAFSLASSIT